MRAPAKKELTAEQIHFNETKRLVGMELELNTVGSLSADDMRVYHKYQGTPEAVAKRIIEARKNNTK